MLLLLARSIDIVARKIRKSNKNYRMLQKPHEVARNVYAHPTLSEAPTNGETSEVFFYGAVSGNSPMQVKPMGA